MLQTIELWVQAHSRGMLKPKWGLVEAHGRPRRCSAKLTRSQTEAKVKPNWSQTEARVKPKWSQTEAKLKPEWSQTEAKVKPNWSQTEAKRRLMTRATPGSNEQMCEASSQATWDPILSTSRSTCLAALTSTLYNMLPLRFRNTYMKDINFCVKQYCRKWQIIRRAMCENYQYSKWQRVYMLWRH